MLNSCRSERARNPRSVERTRRRQPPPAREKLQLEKLCGEQDCVAVNQQAERSVAVACDPKALYNAYPAACSLSCIAQTNASPVHFPHQLPNNQNVKLRFAEKGTCAYLDFFFRVINGAVEGFPCMFLCFNSQMTSNGRGTALQCLRRSVDEAAQETVLSGSLYTLKQKGQR